MSKNDENYKQRLITVPILVSPIDLYFESLIMMAMSNIVDFEKNGMRGRHRWRGKNVENR
ncbi:hypothetical protein DD595_25220 [Enterobacter cloacae complex sp. 4DZ3-17B2]|uniref:hypothetical protein n=1 Tax=Enterobacter cloacae complex sp. 4DZ3-17B2 TaxID=2511990 RepID=UPI0010114F3C|nr:hypothetical protein [Enterobacter cloacae complex sp. 4DZ3-17B2]RYA72766.1 hypothetical protein DD595_25220 [Enterobacter cloacae complex sp. 4DZ3-17B2]